MEDAEEPAARHVHVLLPRAPVHAGRVPRQAAIAIGHLTLDELLIADPPSAWAALGFAVDEGGACDVGTVRLQLGAGGGEGIVGWALRGIARGAAFDGLATVPSGAPERAAAPASAHPNGARRLDHLVVTTPDLARTLAALTAAGLEVRREREAGDRRQAFLWVGDTILEVVAPAQPGGDQPARLWGLVVVVDDLDAACGALGEGLVSGPRDAVQPGRRIATVRRAAGLGTRLALMSPHPR